MIWPFKPRKPAISLAEFAATKPMPLCEKPEEHWNWELNHCPCPACAEVKMAESKAREGDRLAEKIAATVVRKLQENKA